MHIADVTNPLEVGSMIKNIMNQWGGLDILINNAGGSQQPKGPVDTLESEALMCLLQLNVIWVHIVTLTVLQLAVMENNGGIILYISSKVGKVGLENCSLYVATSKFALEGLTFCFDGIISSAVINDLESSYLFLRDFQPCPLWEWGPQWVGGPGRDKCFKNEQQQQGLNKNVDTTDNLKNTEQLVMARRRTFSLLVRIHCSFQKERKTCFT
jgi:hypothetical protein